MDANMGTRTSKSMQGAPKPTSGEVIELGNSPHEALDDDGARIETGALVATIPDADGSLELYTAICGFGYTKRYRALRGCMTIADRNRWAVNAGKPRPERAHSNRMFNDSLKAGTVGTQAVVQA